MTEPSGDPSPWRALRGALSRWMDAAGTTGRALQGGLALLVPEAPLELRIAGRVLLHAAVVGLLAGAVGAAFFAALELGQHLLLHGLAGFEPARARGEAVVAGGGEAAFRPWLLALLPAVGGLVSGLITTRLAPEAAGGGGDATIEAYHRGGLFRWRVAPVKFAAAFAALSSGGSGGREGPTMQIGAAIGSLAARLLPTTRRERRVLFVAGVAAGISAVFRTPLGAALLATEMLYRDDFEADALVPSILASVVAYSVVIAAFGETTLLGFRARFPFDPRQLPLFAGLALLVSLAAVAFVRLLRAVQAAARKLPGPTWLRPALGGLAAGLLGAGMAIALGSWRGPEARGFTVLGGGYGTAQVAMDGAPWFPGGWQLVALLLAVAAAKALASALTIGCGAAVGDFAPSLVIGGLVGTAFGHAARAALGDPAIEPAAFALVGMGAFYGGVAHVPLSALVLVAELAGSYDLLVPMMLTVGISYVVLRRWSLYPTQPTSRAEASGAPGEALRAALARPVAELLVAPELPDFREDAPLAAVAAASAGAAQRVALVRGADGRPRGLVDLGLLGALAPAELGWTRAADAMVPFVTLVPSATWREAIAALHRRGLPQLPVVQAGTTTVLGWVGERELARAALALELGGEGQGAAVQPDRG
ncbi:chloride channel protein [Anaeromyxobacter sp. Fw109-5]|uniref:chloride channel protein n=1 Tax=Anaeromyxobacter sp. (strain Fw109-5) TaxID=404589 RepID=UPI0000ED73DE|nr:chloride channel protein [Anaeromyxobacter sp. Fw109-5]ABS26590.1 Chloride channel core [Anaeromyxobacter sp. Fw109-5]